MFRALKAHLQVETLYVCGIWYLTLYESSGWPVGAQFEFPLKLCTDSPQRNLVESDNTICCIYTVFPPEDEPLRLETCRGI